MFLVMENKTNKYIQENFQVGTRNNKFGITLCLFTFKADVFLLSFFPFENCEKRKEKILSSYNQFFSLGKWSYDEVPS